MQIWIICISCWFKICIHMLTLLLSVRQIRSQVLNNISHPAAWSKLLLLYGRTPSWGSAAPRLAKATSFPGAFRESVRKGSLFPLLSPKQASVSSYSLICDVLHNGAVKLNHTTSFVFYSGLGSRVFLDLQHVNYGNQCFNLCPQVNYIMWSLEP